MSDPTVLYRVLDALAELLAGVPEPDDAATALFGGNIAAPEDWDTPAGPENRTARIYFQGEPVPYGGTLPLAVIRPGDESNDDEVVTTAQGHRLPIDIEVVLDLNPAQEGAPDVRDIHTRILAEIRDRLEANRDLPQVGYVNPTTGTASTVTDTKYLGGGAALDPLDQAKLPHRYSFNITIQADYRHDRGDSRTHA